ESHAADAVHWTDTEEFIEDKYPVDIMYSLNLDCTVTQDGFHPRSLREILIRRFRLSARKSLLFRAYLTEMEEEEPYTVMWK
ncbi:nucleotidyltransferase, partial [Escherichia coli]|uniref:nucleotide-binding domain-containing protein n=1 Tax=Escherichia coli TaxID=562 RepID=UPI0040487CCD|nr:nucleotidyltransferase [Escherichia coli]